MIRMEIKSVEKALDILESFSAAEAEMGVSDLSRRLGINPTSVYKILATLKKRGYVRQDVPKGKYRLGIKMFELGCVFQEQSPLFHTARPLLEALGKSCGETVNLAILSPDLTEILYVDKIESREVLKTDIRLGTRLPAHCTALGKAITAFLPAETVDELYPPDLPLPGLTENSISTTIALKNALEEARNAGYAVDNEEFRHGVRCVAAPIMDRQGRALAAISITGPAFRLTPDRLKELLKPLKETARILSERLGYSAAGTPKNRAAQ